MENHAVLNKIILENFSRFKYLSLLLISYSVFVLIIDFAPIKVWNDEFIEIYRILDILLAVFTFSALLFFWLYKKDDFSIKNLGVKLTLFFILIWSAIVTGLEITSLGFSTLILIMLIAVFFIYINLKTSITYFLSAFISLIVTVFIQNKLDESFIPTFFIILPITIVSILISRKNYISKVNELINSDKLKELNNELNAIKEHLEEEVEKRTKELYIAKEKAEESDRLKSAFLANMGHEIRTPMNGILGFSALLSEPGLDSEDQQEYISIIQKSGTRMLNIINEIVEISKIESGLMNVYFKDTNINEHIEYVYDLLQPEAESKKLNISFKNNLPDNEAVINTDGEKLYAILINIVKNAIKYTDEGSIEFGYNLKSNVSTSPKYVDELEFFVIDTGIGIPYDRQKAIFERFIQADIADVEARQGAGLGLSIAKAYVEMLNGRIWVESEHGKGSKFYFTLPYQIADEEKININ
jgi:signal transduction histidine kinase